MTQYFFHHTEKWIHKGWLPAWDAAYAPGDIVQIEEAMAESLWVGNGQGLPIEWDEETGCPYLGEKPPPVVLTADEIEAKRNAVRDARLRERYRQELDPLTNEATLKREAGLSEEAAALFARAIALKAQIQGDLPPEAIHIAPDGTVTIDTPPQ